MRPSKHGLLALCFLLANVPACTDEEDGNEMNMNPATGGDNGDGDGEGPSGDGDGDVQSGDGDGDVQSGDGDGDVQNGDGDRDGNADGDGDASPSSCAQGPFSPDVEELPVDVAPPIVFVHGFAGSAQQFQSQAMRFDANGYPQERIYAYDHPGGLNANTNQVVSDVDKIIDDAIAKFKVDKVVLVGHSRGTFMSNSYLGNAARARKVAKYISLDGAGCGSATGAGVDCLEPNQSNLPGQKHVEVATSPESFARMFKFITNRDPVTTQILPKQGATTVKISGRAVDFPDNTGKAGAVLKIFEIDPATGHRLSDAPVATANIGADGNFGPVELGCGKHYEKELSLPGSNAFQHFYTQPYVRDTNFVRLLSAPANAESVANTNLGDGHAAVVVMRMREWCDGDELHIETKRPSGGQPSVNALTSQIVNCSGGLVGGAIGIYIHDDKATPGNSSLQPLPWFPQQAFQTGVDVFMPAADPPDGTITFRSVPRGYTDKPQVLNVPNWASTTHRLSVYFNDYHQ